jgi:hypothetical protein
MSVDDLKGRELDALVAERLFGLEVEARAVEAPLGIDGDALEDGAGLPTGAQAPAFGLTAAALPRWAHLKERS